MMQMYRKDGACSLAHGVLSHLLAVSKAVELLQSCKKESVGCERVPLTLKCVKTRAGFPAKEIQRENNGELSKRKKAQNLSGLLHAKTNEKAKGGRRRKENAGDNLPKDA